MACECRDYCGRRRIREGSGLKGLEVRALSVQLGLEYVARGAHILHLVHSRRRRAMVSMARRAGGRAQIAPYGQRLMVHARAVLRILIGGNAVRLHVGRIGMAARARRRHVDGIHRRTGIAGRPYIVDAMAIRADRNLGVSRREPFAMHAGVVLVQLVGAQAGVVLPDIRRIRVAASAQLRHVFVTDLALPAGLPAHGLAGS